MYENPRIQRLLSSDRTYYIKKAFRELRKAKETYIEDMLILVKEALLDGLSPEELGESITPNLIKKGLEGLPFLKKQKKIIEN